MISRLLFRALILMAIVVACSCALAQIPQRSSSSDFEQEMERARHHQPPALPPILSDGDKVNLARAAGADEYQNGSNSFASADILENGEVLFASRTDDGRCLKLMIFRRSGFMRKDFEPVWSARSASGTDFCAPPPCRPPSVWVPRSNAGRSSNDHSVFTVSIPRRASPEDRSCDNAQTIEYGYKKGNYEVLEMREQPVWAGFYDCWLAIDRSLMQGDEIVTIEVLPALAVKRYGIAVRKVEGKLVADKIEIPRPLVSILSGKPVRPSECNPQSVPSSVRLKMQESQLTEFIDELGKIDLHTDRCPRTKSGNCALFADGTILRIVFGSSPVLELTELGGFDKISSENPALYQWVHKVLKAADMTPR